MGIRIGRTLGLTSVAVVLMLITACSGNDAEPQNATPTTTTATLATPSASPTSGLLDITLFPELGTIEGVLHENGKTQCGRNTATLDARIGGTFTYNGTKIGVSQMETGTTVHVDGSASSLLAVVATGDKGSAAAPLNSEVRSHIGDAYYQLHTNNWGKLGKITICAESEGM